MKTWITKIMCADRVWADGLYRALSRSMLEYDGFEELSHRGNVITMKGQPGTMVHLVAKHAREMELDRVVKVIMTPDVTS